MINIESCLWDLAKELDTQSQSSPLLQVAEIQEITLLKVPTHQERGRRLQLLYLLSSSCWFHTSTPDTPASAQTDFYK